VTSGFGLGLSVGNEGCGLGLVGESLLTHSVKI